MKGEREGRMFTTKDISFICSIKFFILLLYIFLGQEGVVVDLNVYFLNSTMNIFFYLSFQGESEVVVVVYG